MTGTSGVSGATTERRHKMSLQGQISREEMKKEFLDMIKAKLLLFRDDRGALKALMELEKQVNDLDVG